ncbi:TetR/AcrR family transcriptional regulator [Streptomyces sp. NPDC047000]|uniref:TetR/AcrR family transcriptional regulator n=1 Tax=Streptomyces sp. NPDC047000 TaxID=3155474 RepID=UPI0033D10D7D
MSGMAQAEVGTGGRVSEARERLLRTAGQLFYAEGIHTVGVDRLVAEAKVTNATFYRHFRSKEDLVVAYVRSVDQAIRAQLGALTAAGLPADGILRGIGASLVEQIRSPGYRGCAFLNAAAEFPAPDHPVHRAVVQHRAWYLRTITGLFAETADAPAEHAGRHFVMLRDGAMSGGHLDGPAEAGETLLRGIEGLLRAHTGRGPDESTAPTPDPTPPATTTISGPDCSPPAPQSP